MSILHFKVQIALKNLRLSSKSIIQTDSMPNDAKIAPNAKISFVSEAGWGQKLVLLVASNVLNDAVK